MRTTVGLPESIVSSTTLKSGPYETMSLQLSSTFNTSTLSDLWQTINKECKKFSKNFIRTEKAAWNSFIAVVRDRKLYRLWRIMLKWAAGCPSNSTSLTLILISSRRIWKRTQTSASIRIYWILNAVIKERMTKTRETIRFIKVIYSINVNREWLLTCKFLVVSLA